MLPEVPQAGDRALVAGAADPVPVSRHHRRRLTRQASLAPAVLTGHDWPVPPGSGATRSPARLALAGAGSDGYSCTRDTTPWPVRLEGRGRPRSACGAAMTPPPRRRRPPGPTSASSRTSIPAVRRWKPTRRRTAPRRVTEAGRRSRPSSVRREGPGQQRDLREAGRLGRPAVADDAGTVRVVLVLPSLDGYLPPLLLFLRLGPLPGWPEAGTERAGPEVIPSALIIWPPAGRALGITRACTAGRRSPERGAGR